MPLRARNGSAGVGGLKMANYLERQRQVEQIAGRIVKFISAQIAAAKLTRTQRGRLWAEIFRRAR